MAASRRARLQQARESGADPGDDVNHNDHAIDIDAGRARRIGIGANSVHIAAELCITRMQMPHQKRQNDKYSSHRQHKIAVVGDNARQGAAAQPGECFGKKRNTGAGRDAIGSAAQHKEHGDGDQQIVDADFGYQDAIKQTDTTAKNQHQRDHQQGMKLPSQSAGFGGYQQQGGEHRRQTQRRLHRQIEVARDECISLAENQHAESRRAQQDIVQVVRR